MRARLVRLLLNRNVWALTVGALALLLAAFSAVAYPDSTGAQAAPPSASKTAANTLKVSPVRTDIEVLPGSREVVQVTVTNLADQPVTVRPVANDFVAGDERGTPAIILDETEYAPTHSLKRFISPLSPVTIGPRESKTIYVVVTVPKEAQAGGYFGSIRFMPSSPDTGGQVNLSPSIASLVLLKVPGQVVEDMSVRTFEVQQGGKGSFYFQDPQDLSLATRFENKGNVQVAPRGRVAVSRGSTVIYEADFNAETPADMILPDSIRRWDIPLKDIGSIGYFTATSTISYGDKNQTLELKQSFWVAPLWFFLAAAGTILVLVAGIITWVIIAAKRRARYGRSHVKKRPRFGSASQPPRRRF